MPTGPVAELTVKALTALLRTSEPRHLLPDGHEAGTVSAPLTLVGAAPLGRGTWLTVVRTGTGSVLSAPVVREGDRLRRARPGDGAAVQLLAAFAQRPQGWSPGFEILQTPESTVSLEVTDPAERPMLVDQ